MMKKVAVVTGAGRGIGKAIAKAYAQNEYRVVLAELNQERGELTQLEFVTDGLDAVFIRTDISNLDQICSLINQVDALYGRIDVLINNAGISEFADPYKIQEAKWDRVIDTNLKGTFFCSREAAKIMRKNQGGSIVNISSTRAVMSEPNSEAYAASKGGILALTHAMAASFSTDKISVNAVLPGWIENGDYTLLLPEDHAQHFSQRVGKPEDVARACLFLTNKENDFITGSQLVIDGGMTRKMIYEE